jgi:hypothetical protein
MLGSGPAGRQGLETIALIRGIFISHYCINTEGQISLPSLLYKREEFPLFGKEGPGEIF